MKVSTSKVFGVAAALVDEAVRLAALSRTSRRTRALGHAERLARLEAMVLRYRELGAHGRFFREPREIVVAREERLRRPDTRVIDLSWPSDTRAFLPEVQAKLDRHVENRTARARLVLHDEPRPVMLLIHGYLGGVHRTERRVWPMEFFHRIGMDAVLFVLPFHGERRRGWPAFPSADPRVTNEGFRQAVGDLRDLVRWLLGRHPSVGVMGMSLGGFTTALAATQEPALSFAVPVIPLASIADLARRNGQLGRDREEAEALHPAVARAHAVSSPLSYPAVIPKERILVVGAEYDRITPIEHARKLAIHFDCRLETMPGAHLVQIGRGERWRSVARFLNGLGVIERR